MTSFKSLRFLLSFVIFALISGQLSYAALETPTTEEAFPPRWELLGSRKVNYRLDRDEIMVTAREGVFSKVKLKVRKGGINMHRMVIHFRNGEKQEVAIRKNIAVNGETRVIDLKGGRRVIRKVVFWYDTKGVAGRRATVNLWGRN